jgi:signal transduction histidine kinase
VSTSLAYDFQAISSIKAIPNILEVVCRTTGMGFAAVAHLTENRWIACAVRDEISFGLVAGGELLLETTICNDIRETGHPIAIDHVDEDQVFCNHPTPKLYGFQSYISVPIYRQGLFFGTLCALDPTPRRVNTPETVGMFRLFADLIAFHLDTEKRLELSETALIDEKHTALLREQFIAALGHDLRNPLNAISNGAHVLMRMPLSEEASSVAATVQRSAARMAGLIDNLMDFARGRLGGGIPVTRIVDPNLETILKQAIAEMQIASPERSIHCELALSRPVACDGSRIAQMFSNLLGNAITHGDSAGPIWVSAISDDTGFELSVANLGEPIPVEDLERLFQPFSRPSTGSAQQPGLGLGLYIASEIARAHGGSLGVSSTSEETRFTFRMPAIELARAAETS